MRLEVGRQMALEEQEELSKKLAALQPESRNYGSLSLADRFAELTETINYLSFVDGLDFNNSLKVAARTITATALATNEAPELTVAVAFMQDTESGLFVPDQVSAIRATWRDAVGPFACERVVLADLQPQTEAERQLGLLEESVDVVGGLQLNA